MDLLDMAAGRASWAATVRHCDDVEEMILSRKGFGRSGFTYGITQ